ncbi:hypothetical protein SAMN05443633_112120 [Chryseobacterium arachidis]|uniref:Uncharacterized protein n=2 Tax=Chryseobacterium arachidis TaxID=1416778 RepID=A0A1M5IFK2_9FLAO|nr:hypothetical protein [Chryseobacterium arachidis]SHG27118.1 hypothetical protein SAMN05443633_112120 [Chryseobacterium arachidis]
MEDTIGLLEEYFDKKKFRVTYKQQDYDIVLLKKDLIQGTSEINIFLDGVVQKLVKRDSRWSFDHGNDEELANDIWRVISLRYRIFN